jgi:hypothetical protein
MAYMQSDYVAARSLQEEARAISHALGDARGEVEALDATGRLESWLGNWITARRCFEVALTIAGELSDRPLRARLQSLMAFVLYNLGDAAAAETLALQAAATQDDLRLVMRQFSLHILGQLAQDRRDFAAARARFEEALAINRAGRDADGLGGSLFHLGDLALEEGMPARARPLLAESLALRVQTGQRVRLAMAIEGFASLAAAQAQPVRALRLAGAAVAVRAAVGAVAYPSWYARLQRRLVPAVQTLSAAARAAAWAEGQRMCIEHAVEQCWAV